MTNRNTALSRVRRPIIVGIVCLAIAIPTYRYLRAAPKKNVATQAIPVVVQTAQRRDLPVTLDAIGNVQAQNSVNVKVRVDGQLQQVYFREGQLVHAGDLLGQVDPRPYEAQALQARSTLDKDQAQLTSSLVDYTRAQKLAAAGAGPTQAVDTLRAQVAAFHAAIEGDQANLEIAKLQLSFTRITSPITGRTGQRLIDAGAIVHGADTSGLVTITQLDPISIQFSVSQDVLPAIQAANSKGPLTVVALMRDNSRQLASGKLAFIDSQVNSSSGQIQLKADFANANGLLWPGELVSVRLLQDTIHGVTVVPAAAVQSGQKGSFIYIVNGDNTVSPRQIQPGEVVDGMQQIISGIEPGQNVVTAGQFRLTAGTKVSPLQPAPAVATLTGEAQ